ncbi:putative membrane protein DUF2142 [Frondihabitans sp. PhB188]|uniref:glycosyltransferase family 39 protein n=1 Tax=Frondihabitans sp. PhB188 TaxID=2485200 RepID=UPI000F489A3E|nr:DUF2142 domain-containing protein [Frondihabitans sp. PhB188]ROQ36646.1 putative membrane protein DUF2142 [Frondihabitans sp. PhB188]
MSARRGAARAGGTLAERRSTLAVITVCWGLVLVLWAVLTPMYGAPDEPAHVDSAIRLQGEHTWPAPGSAHYLSGVRHSINDEIALPAADRSTFGELLTANPGYSKVVDQMTQHPPLYYAVAGLVLKAIHFESLRWDLVVTALRLFDVLLVLPLPLLVWATVRRLTRSPKLAVLGAMGLFAVPQLQQIAASVTNDAPMMLLGGGLTWLVARYLTGAQRWRDVVAIGVVLGVMLLTKGTGLPAVPFVAVGMLIAAPIVDRWGRRILHAFVALAVALVLGGWWWLRNLYLYHDFQPSGLADVHPTAVWPPGKGPDPGVFLTNVWNGVPASFWGKFGLLRYPMLNVVTDTLTVLAVGIVIAFAFRRGVNRRTALALAVMPTVTLALLLFNIWRIFDRTARIYGTQGRYFYVAIVALLALSVIAWSAAVTSERMRRLAARVVTIGAPALTLYGLSVEYRGAFEKSYLAVDYDGLYTWAYSTPVGPEGIVLVLALVAVALVLTIIRTTRAALERPRPDLPREARPAVV